MGVSIPCSDRQSQGSKGTAHMAGCMPCTQLSLAALPCPPSPCPSPTIPLGPLPLAGKPTGNVGDSHLQGPNTRQESRVQANSPRHRSVMHLPGARDGHPLAWEETPPPCKDLHQWEYSFAKLWIKTLRCTSHLTFSKIGVFVVLFVWLLFCCGFWFLTAAASM